MLSWMRDKLYIGRQKIGKALSRRSANDFGISDESDNCSSNTDKMIVDDANIFPNEKVKLHIIGLDGSVWSVLASPETNIAVLKAQALNHFFNPIESSKIQQNIKLLAVSTKRILSTENTIQEENLGPEEEIVLVTRRTIEIKDSMNPEDIQKGPTQKDILSATEHLTPRNIIKIPPPLDCSEDFQTEFRKILISLVEVAAQLLSSRPNANEIFLSIVERLETRDKIVPDRNAIRNLIEMGFSEERVTLALRLKRNNPAEALEWLLEKGASKTDINQSVEDLQAAGTVENTNEKPTIVQSVSRLLATFRSFRRKEFRPSVKALQAMLEMGFQEKDIVEALRITGNNQSAACEWILGERSEILQDLDTGLDPEGPIYKALLSNPTIQLGLNNPRMLLAFLSILENPQSANTWLHDSDAAPVLNQIFKTYHAEKHILAVNRHVEAYRSS